MLRRLQPSLITLLGFCELQRRMETRERFRVRVTADGRIAISSPQMSAFGKYECHICNDWPAAIPTSVTLRTACLIGSKSAAYVSTYLWSSCDLWSHSYLCMLMDALDGSWSELRDMWSKLRDKELRMDDASG